MSLHRVYITINNLVENNTLLRIANPSHLKEAGVLSTLCTYLDVVKGVAFQIDCGRY